MAIGRTFEESLQKALRMTHPTMDGFTTKLPAGKDYPEDFDMEKSLKIPHNTRIHTICKVRDASIVNRNSINGTFSVIVTFMLL